MLTPHALDIDCCVCFLNVFLYNFLVCFTVCEHSSVGGFASFIHYVYGVFEHGAAL